MRLVIALAGLGASLACLLSGKTGASMVGFMPPHYGYSAFFESAALFAGPLGLQVLCGLAMLVSTNRCSWVGAIAGWGYLGGWRRRAAAAGLIVVAVVVGGQVVKPNPYNDIIRKEIWRAALAHPAVGDRAFAKLSVLGVGVGKAHSDVLQAYVDWGPWGLALALLALLGGAWWLLRGPRTLASATVVCLTTQLLFDNRLHYPPCAALFVTAWVWAWFERRELLGPLRALPAGPLPWP